MAKKHTHKYHQVLMNSIPIWACALPDCTHYMPNHLKNMVAGKASFCWGCDAPIVLDPVNMKLEQPLCSNCLGITVVEPENDFGSLADYLQKHTG